MVESIFCRVYRFLYSSSSIWSFTRTAVLLRNYFRKLEAIMSQNQNYETHKCDVLIIGAGGAGLRAASYGCCEGVSVALVCKSLLGKAHTVMAEGGIAAALANVDTEDNWKTH